jgi:hypothetical protein
MADHDVRGSLTAIERSKIRRLGQVRALSPDATGAERRPVPRRDRQCDDLRARHPRGDPSEQAYITANPGVDYQTIIDTTDAVRAGPRGEPLFPEINFRVPR